MVVGECVNGKQLVEYTWYIVECSITKPVEGCLEDSEITICGDQKDPIINSATAKQEEWLIC